MKHKQIEEAPGHPPTLALCPPPLKGSSTLQVRTSHRQVEGACIELGRSGLQGQDGGLCTVVCLFWEVSTRLYICGGQGICFYYRFVATCHLPFHILFLGCINQKMLIFYWENM